MARWFVLIFGIFLVCDLASSYKILSFYPTISKSQWVFGMPLLTALAEKGHHVTSVSPFSLGKNVTNLNEVVIPLDFSGHEQLTDGLAKGQISGNPLSILIKLQQILLEASNETINHPTFQRIMKEESFAAVIHGYTLNIFQLGLAAHFKCPSILLSSVPITGVTNELMGQPLNMAEIPTFLMSTKGKMNFFQRVVNLFIVMLEKGLGAYSNYMNAPYYEYNFPSDKYPSFSEVRKNVSLFLANDHFTQGTIRPNLPNVIEVSGLQMSSKSKPLPDDIKPWVEGAKDGLVFVSFGTNIKSKDLSLEKRQALLNNFARLKQRVLWKFEDDSIKNLPKNVMIKKWLPQTDILAHSNTKLFISHMGIGGYNEAMFYAVPVLAMPFGADQVPNAEKAKKEGWAEILLPSDLTETNLKNVLDKLLPSKKYKEAVKKLSDLYRDKPMSAVDTATFWIEYVIRHKGAKHMEYPGKDMNFIQSSSLDVFGFIFLILYLFYKIITFGCRKLKAICSSKQKVVDAGKQKTN